MKIDKLNRRVFLQGVGGLLVAIPALPSLMEKAGASVTPRNKRFFTLCVPSQIQHNIAFKVTEADLAGITYNGFRSLPLTNGNFSTICPMMGDAFKPYMNQLSLVRGLFLGNLGHTGPGLLGNPSTSATFDDSLPLEKTIDVVMALKSGMTLNDILRIGAETNYWSPTHDGTNTLKFTNNGNPFLIYQNYFTSLPVVPAGNVAGKKSLVDRIKNDMTNSLLNRGFISTADKKYLQDHMDFLNDLEKTYGGAAPVISCTPSTNNFFNTRPPGQQSINMVNPDLTKPADFQKFMKDSARLIVESIKCNVFKIGNMRLAASFLDADLIGGTVWHLEHSHTSDNAGILKMNQWLMENVYLEIIKGLDTDEGGGSTFLDNSIIAYTPEFSEGHCGYDVPLFLAGKGGGTVETGRFWDFGDPGYTYVLNHPKDIDGSPLKFRAGMAYNRYWNGILQSWGLVPSDYEKVVGTDGSGNPIYRPGYGERDHLYTHKVAWHPPRLQTWIETNKSAYFADIGKPLPGLFKIPA